MSDQEAIPNIDDLPPEVLPDDKIGFENITTAVQLFGKALSPETVPQVTFVLSPPDLSDLPDMGGNWSLTLKLDCKDLSREVESVIVNQRAWKVEAASEQEVLAEAYKLVTAELSILLAAREQEIAGIRQALAILNHPVSPGSMWNTTDPPDAADPQA